jgi:hypothetical protein
MATLLFTPITPCARAPARALRVPTRAWSAPVPRGLVIKPICAACVRSSAVYGRRQRIVNTVHVPETHAAYGTHACPMQQGNPDVPHVVHVPASAPQTDPAAHSGVPMGEDRQTAPPRHWPSSQHGSPRSLQADVQRPSAAQTSARLLQSPAGGFDRPWVQQSSPSPPHGTHKFVPASVAMHAVFGSLQAGPSHHPAEPGGLRPQDEPPSGISPLQQGWFKAPQPPQLRASQAPRLAAQRSPSGRHIPATQHSPPLHGVVGSQDDTVPQSSANAPASVGGAAPSPGLASRGGLPPSDPAPRALPQSTAGSSRRSGRRRAEQLTAIGGSNGACMRATTDLTDTCSACHRSTCR